MYRVTPLGRVRLRERAHPALIPLQTQLAERVVRLLARENRPVSLLGLRERLRCKETALQDVVDALAYEGLLELHCFRDYVYVTLSLPLFGTDRFRAYQKFNSLLFEVQHYRELARRLARMSEELRLRSENISKEASLQ